MVLVFSINSVVLTVVSDRTVMAELTGLVLLKLYLALDISKTFHSVSDAGPLHKLKSNGTLG